MANESLYSLTTSCYDASLCLMMLTITSPFLCPGFSMMPESYMMMAFAEGAIAEIEGSKVWQLVSKVKQQIKHTVQTRPARQRLFPRLFR